MKSCHFNKSILLKVILVLFVLVNAHAEDIHVDCHNMTGFEDGSPAHPFRTIQKALDTALDGSTVLVAPGSYEENIIMKERVHLLGSGPSVTFISGEGKQLHSSLILWAVIWAADHSLLEGFTITVTPPDGSYNRYAVQGYTEDRNDPIIANNVFMGSSGNTLISFRGGSARIVNNTFFGNQLQFSLISVNNHLRSGVPVVANNIFANNQIRNVVKANNGAQPEVSFNILWDNRNESEDFWGFTPGPGNKWENPCFIDPASGDLRLLPSSPAIDAGDNDFILPFLPTYMPGNSRIVNGTIDIGAYEAYENDGVHAQNIYYVDVVNGDNNNNGLTLETALATIQKGIDEAVDGELVLVYPGLYQEEIDFTGKAITVQGVVVSPIGAPVLQNPGDIAVSFYSSEGPESILRNFIVSDSFMGVFIAGSSPAISNLTIVDNKYGVEAYAGSEPDISNSILWNNTNGDLFGCEARYSCIERGGEGEGNISSDPLFVEVHSDDYHLRSERGRYWREYDVWILDEVTSPCIDGGDPNADVSDEPMPNGGRINMGAYGGTVEASLSLSEQPCPASLGKAFNPNPVDGAIDIDIDIILNWTAGLNTIMHDVYFGTNPILGSVDLISAQQVNTSYQFTGSLAPSTTYYWRVDEFDGVSTQKGEVWRFTTVDIEGGIKGEYYKGLDFEDLVMTRIDPQINFNWGSSGPDPSVGDDNFSVKWTGDVAAAFTETYTFYTNSDGGIRLWIDGQRLINRWWYDPSVITELTGSIYLVGGQTYSLLMEYQARRGNGMVELYWESPHTAKQLVPQAALSLPFKARYPNPANGAIEVKFTPVLTWDRGDYAASHNVYFGTHEQAVRNAIMSSPEYKGAVAAGNEIYDPRMLDWYTTYYWRIDEVNQTNPNSPWKGNVWSFTTVDFIVVDDFESYNDLNEDEPGSNRIYLTWIDGFDNPTENGSIVGDLFPGPEITIVHSGNQSMPFSYDNAVGKSWATANIANLEIGHDWTIDGVEILSLWFRGTPGNDPETMYVVLNDTAGVDNDNPNAAQVDSWTEWRIDLQEFADQGVNLANINTITIGFGDRDNPIAGGSGRVWFDDIRLYRPTLPYWPAPGLPEPPF